MSKASFRAVVGGVGFSLLYTGTGLDGAIICSVFALVHFPVLLELLFVPLNTDILPFIVSLYVVTGIVGFRNLGMYRFSTLICFELFKM